MPKKAIVLNQPNFLDNLENEFIKWVLNFPIAHLDKPYIPSDLKISAAYKNYTNKTRDSYYFQYKPFVLEEVRYLLSKKEAGDATLLTVQSNLKSAHKMRDISSFQASLILPNTYENHSKSYIALYIPHFKNLKEPYLALANVCKDGTFKIKIAIQATTEEKNLLDTITEGESFSAYILGSLLLYVSMFVACHPPNKDEIISFESQIVTGKLSPPEEPKEPQFELYTEELNDSQKLAIESFSYSKNGLYLWWGPPGGGKTKTLVQQMLVACKNGIFTIVCAPSNKAVYVNALRFLKMKEEEKLRASVLLIGVDNRLPDSLRDIFLDTWEQNLYQLIEKMLAHISNINLRTLVNYKGNRESKLKENFKLINEYLESIKEKIAVYLPPIARKIEDIFLDIEGWINNYQKTSKNISKKFWKNLKQSYQNQDSQTLDILYANDSFLKRVPSLINIIKQAIPPKNDLLNILVQNADIIFTTVGSANRKIFQNIKKGCWLLFDEAGQMLEIETLGVIRMVSPSKILLVGDTQQLSPIVQSPALKDSNFGWSMMWRLQRECNQACIILNIQYRMKPEILRLSSHLFYGDLLKSDVSVSTRLDPVKHLPDILNSYSFIHIESKENRKNLSFYNKEEAIYIAGIIKYYKEKANIDSSSQIAVITPYSAQKELIQEELQKIGYNKVPVATVDSFQGDECDIVIVSLVRKNEAGDIGFLKNSQRLNVTITRARHALIILGNAETFLVREENEIFTKLLLVTDKWARLFFENTLKEILTSDVSNIESKLSSNKPTLNIENKSESPSSHQSFSHVRKNSKNSRRTQYYIKHAERENLNSTSLSLKHKNASPYQSQSSFFKSIKEEGSWIPYNNAITAKKAHNFEWQQKNDPQP